MPQNIKTCSFLFYILLIPALCLAQISGKVTDETDAPILGVNIYVENTYIGTTSNVDGVFYLENSPKEGGILVFQSLGFKSFKRKLEPREQISDLLVRLIPEAISLDEVVLNTSEDPAYGIMRKAIAARKSHLEQLGSYRADFYSRGLIALDSVPEKIFGQEVGDLDGAIDSTRSGILYLSETFSKLSFRQPDDLIENITASKVSGNNNGFSFNMARDVDFNLYRNDISINQPILSPLANGAFGTYTYKYEGDFYDDRGHLINKIRVTPKRENDAAFTGHIYIVEDQWAIYSVELTIRGSQVQIIPLNELTISQSFAFDQVRDQWILRTQLLDFDFGLFGFKGGGRFSAVYSNHVFNPSFDSSEFGNRILKVDRDANKKDSLFWAANRPIPLTEIESKDYVRKDSIRILRESKPYLDSIDKKNNRFKLGVFLNDYNHKNSFDKRSWGFSSPLKGVHFNTVQGIHVSPDFYYTRQMDEFRRYWNISTTANYGFSDKRLRPRASFYYKFNDINRPYLNIVLGNEAVSINRDNPIRASLNDIYTAFEKNYLKLFERSFIRLAYGQEWVNGLNGSIALTYEDRKSLFNTTNQVVFPQPRISYTSNNPLQPANNDAALFQRHGLFIVGMNFRVIFGQDYLEYPDSKYFDNSGDYPTLFFSAKKGFGASVGDYNFGEAQVKIRQNLNLGRLGNLNYNGFAGSFFNSDQIAFVDYHHFNGNQTIVRNQEGANESYNLLDYYLLSTNKSYAGFHLEHHFNGFIMNRVPLISKLNWNVVGGLHYLKTEDQKPYLEWNIGLENIGFKKLKFLRVDYVQSHHNGQQNNGILLGIDF